MTPPHPTPRIHPHRAQARPDEQTRTERKGPITWPADRARQRQGESEPSTAGQGAAERSGAGQDRAGQAGADPDLTLGGGNVQKIALLTGVQCEKLPTYQAAPFGRLRP